jgi:hypothetical protein
MKLVKKHERNKERKGRTELTKKGRKEERERN